MGLTRNNNRIVVSLNKVAYAWFFYRNQDGTTRPLKPQYPTCHGTGIPQDEYAWPYNTEFPGETALERAKRLGIVDRWVPVVRLRMSAADVLEFSGERAVGLWKEWRRRQFKPTKQNNATKPC